MKCSKDDCTNDAIKRGKYCVIHRTNKRKKDKDNDVDELNEQFIAKMLENDVWGGGGVEETKNQKDYERRSLIEEQNYDYIEAEKKDRENFRLKQIELDRKIRNRQKFNSYIQQPSDVTLQFIFPTFCLKVRQSFHFNSTLSDLYDFVDIILEDNNINMPEYQMVIYPNNIYFRESSTEKLADINITHGVSILIQRL